MDAKQENESRIANIERNIDYCDDKITDCDARLIKVETSGDDLGELNERKDGYAKKRAELAKELGLVKQLGQVGEGG